MKTVFKPEMVAHIWANQSQQSARNSSDSISVASHELWSYRTVIGLALPWCYLLDSQNHSMTTARHLSYAHRATVNHSKPAFELGGLHSIRHLASRDELPKIIFENAVKQAEDMALLTKNMKTDAGPWRNALREINLLLELAGLAFANATTGDRKKLRKAHDNLLHAHSSNLDFIKWRNTIEQRRDRAFFHELRQQYDFAAVTLADAVRMPETLAERIGSRFDTAVNLRERLLAANKGVRLAALPTIEQIRAAALEYTNASNAQALKSAVYVVANLRDTALAHPENDPRASGDCVPVALRTLAGARPNEVQDVDPALIQFAKRWCLSVDAMSADAQLRDASVSLVVSSSYAAGGNYTRAASLVKQARAALDAHAFLAPMAARALRNALAAIPEKEWIDKAAVQYADRWQNWFAGGALPTDAYECDVALRVKNGQLETSRGAQVPIAHAVRVFRFAKLCRERGQSWKRNGKTLRVGLFHVDEVRADGSFVAGCHDISWDAIEIAARQAGVLDQTAADTTDKGEHA